ncbi:MAG: hypothetical protein KA105_01495 [Caulobacter sp.]|jgi:hypothetical protein|nr:hypothetical protein [Caulobacter sp.]
MKAAVLAAFALLAAPACALAQAKPLLLANPADANRDGVVTDEEKADYLARKSAGAADAPPTFGVGAPKPGGNSTIIMGQQGGQPSGEYQTGIAGEAPSAASDFEKSTEDRIRRDAKDD